MNKNAKLLLGGLGVFALGVAVGDTLNMLGTGPVEGIVGLLSPPPAKREVETRPVETDLTVLNETDRSLSLANGLGLPETIEAGQDGDAPLELMGARAGMVYTLSPGARISTRVVTEHAPVGEPVLAPIAVLDDTSAPIRVAYPLHVGAGDWTVRFSEDERGLVVSAEGVVSHD